ncbi:hypothetical protein P376_5772 [Streptomyces sp. HCCB10043]|nr:hypothetical protein P376_5772 [Streptomyces sp. HCCB10043]
MRNSKRLWQAVRGLLPDRNGWLESALRHGLCGPGRLREDWPGTHGGADVGGRTGCSYGGRTTIGR